MSKHAARALWVLAGTPLVACGSFAVDQDTRVQPGADAAPTDAAAAVLPDAAAQPDPVTPDAAPDAALPACAVLPFDANLLEPGVLEAASWPVDDLTFREAGLVALTDDTHPGDVVARCIDPAPHALSFGIRVEYDVLLDASPGVATSATILELGTWNSDAPTLALTAGYGGAIALVGGGSPISVGVLSAPSTIVFAVYHANLQTTQCTFLGSRDDAATACLTVDDLSTWYVLTAIPIDVDTLTIGLSGPANGARTTSQRLSVRALLPVASD